MLQKDLPLQEHFGRTLTNINPSKNHRKSGSIAETDKDSLENDKRLYIPKVIKGVDSLQLRVKKNFNQSQNDPLNDASKMEMSKIGVKNSSILNQTVIVGGRHLRKDSERNHKSEWKRDISPIQIYDKIEAKKKTVLAELPEKLLDPFHEEVKHKKKLPRKQRDDPVRKILATNKMV